MSSPRFQEELADLPPELAAELEDHLHESLAASMRAGLKEEEARVAALRSLGSPVEVARQCALASRSGAAARTRLPLPLRIAVLGWLGVAVGFASRVCAAQEPTAASVAACLVLTGSALALALGLRRHRVPKGLGLALSLGLVVSALTALALGPGLPWVEAALALTPPQLGFLAVFGALSGGALTLPQNRPPQSA